MIKLYGARTVRRSFYTVNSLRLYKEHNLELSYFIPSYPNTLLIMDLDRFWRQGFKYISKLNNSYSIKMFSVNKFTYDAFDSFTQR